MKITALAIATVLGTLCDAGAATLPSDGTFIYSNACASPGGDWTGFRVMLTRKSGSLRVAIEFNDQGPDSGRVRAHDVGFNPESGALRFSYSGGDRDQKHKFNGTVSHENLQGTFDGYKAALPAVRSTPAILLDCR